ncbi:Nucleotide-binding universal stress protein, UspA family [Malonomonas rubra DSM 5091]|uniref:Nucleotide-binding universal stress protein, UspA family n=1 Tax=Malonomonas rubra DSM 5091 TaxID=1122189 RepID=A0A1M6F4K4_MALRU|nr:universal stress protein [Malonomonas rubra]SHI92601.1 Nucleotide-binding universal stress protein, UspA family [Malonomonas rubra DSM 5091]
MIPQYKKIVFATDMSKVSPEVLKHAICIARAHDAKVEILHVLPDIDQAMINYVSLFVDADKMADDEIAHKDSVAAELTERLRKFASAELMDHPEDLERIDRIEVLHGPPASTILSEVEKVGADLLLIGMHGKGKLDYSFVGSVAKKIVRRTQIPVQLIPLTH